MKHPLKDWTEDCRYVIGFEDASTVANSRTEQCADQCSVPKLVVT